MQRIFKGLLTTIAASMLIVALSACGGDDGDSSAAPTPTITPDRTPLQLIPTWTPVPTRTDPPPRPTADTSDLRPSATPFGFNLATTEAEEIATMEGVSLPTAEQPTTTAPQTTASTDETPPLSTAGTATQAPVGVEADPNPTLTITTDAINTAIAQALSDEIGQTFASLPTLAFNRGQIVITATVYTETDGTRSETEVTVRANVLQVQGEPVLTVAEAFYTQDGSPYSGSLTGPQLTAIEDVLQDVVDAQYAAVRPNDEDYYIAVITVGASELTAQTVSIIE